MRFSPSVGRQLSTTGHVCQVSFKAAPSLLIIRTDEQRLPDKDRIAAAYRPST
jgi:hypothetical protein